MTKLYLKDLKINILSIKVILELLKDGELYYIDVKNDLHIKRKISYSKTHSIYDYETIFIIKDFYIDIPSCSMYQSELIYNHIKSILRDEKLNEILND